jgi:hypothetical protein
MEAAGTPDSPGRRRARRLVPAAVIVAIMGVGGAWLASAIREARNAARSAQTT